MKTKIILIRFGDINVSSSLHSQLFLVRYCVDFFTRIYSTVPHSSITPYPLPLLSLLCWCNHEKLYKHITKRVNFLYCVDEIVVWSLILLLLFLIFFSSCLRFRKTWVSPLTLLWPIYQKIKFKRFSFRYGVLDMDGSADRIYNAALGTPEDHMVIFLAHNGPTGV